MVHLAGNAKYALIALCSFAKALCSLAKDDLVCVYMVALAAVEA